MGGEQWDTVWFSTVRVGGCGAHCMPFSLRGEIDMLDTQGYSMDSSHARLLQTVATPKSQIASGPGLHHHTPNHAPPFILLRNIAYISDH